MAGFDWDEYWWTQRCFVPLLGAEVAVSVYPEDSDCAEPTERQLRVFDLVLQLPENLRERLDDAAESYRRSVDDAAGLDWDGVRDINRSNIRAHYRIESIFIPHLRECGHSFFFLQGECDWEEEHGIEFLLRGHEIVHCNHHTGLMQHQRWNGFISGERDEEAPDNG